MRRRRLPRSRTEPAEDPFAVLGLPPTASVDDVVAARRRLAKSLHPDAGGDDRQMQRVNAAAREALSAIAVPPVADVQPPAAPGPEPTPARPAGTHREVRFDHPSFTIEALPAVAFEGLLVVASWLGDLIDDDPPYGLEVALADPHRGWCGLEVVPDAGACTVSIAVAGEPGAPAPDVDEVRAAWVDGLNRLDWDDLDPTRPRPS